jgi:hypothetical protein
MYIQVSGLNVEKVESDGHEVRRREHVGPDYIYPIFRAGWAETPYECGVDLLGARRALCWMDLRRCNDRPCLLRHVPAKAAPVGNGRLPAAFLAFRAVLAGSGALGGGDERRDHHRLGLTAGARPAFNRCHGIVSPPTAGDTGPRHQKGLWAWLVACPCRNPTARRVCIEDKTL